MKKIIINSCFDMTKHRKKLDSLSKQSKEEFLNEYIAARYPRFKVSKACVTGAISCNIYLLCKIDFELEVKDEN